MFLGWWRGAKNFADFEFNSRSRTQLSRSCLWGQACVHCLGLYKHSICEVHGVFALKKKKKTNKTQERPAWKKTDLSHTFDIIQFSMGNFYSYLNSRRLYSITRLFSNIRPSLGSLWSLNTALNSLFSVSRTPHLRLSTELWLWQKSQNWALRKMYSQEVL